MSESLIIFPIYMSAKMSTPKNNGKSDYMYEINCVFAHKVADEGTCIFIKQFLVGDTFRSYAS